MRFRPAPGGSRRRSLGVVREIAERVRDWRAYADAAGVYEPDAIRIDRALRLELSPPA